MYLTAAQLALTRLGFAAITAMSDDGGRESAIQPEFVRVWESTMGHPPSCSPLLVHTGILEAPIRTYIVFLDRVQHLMIRAVRANFIISFTTMVLLCK